MLKENESTYCLITKRVNFKISVSNCFNWKYCPKFLGSFTIFRVMSLLYREWRKGALMVACFICILMHTLRCIYIATLVQADECLNLLIVQNGKRVSEASWPKQRLHFLYLVWFYVCILLMIYYIWNLLKTFIESYSWLSIVQSFQNVKTKMVF